jgi:hypothetical protein
METVQATEREKLYIIQNDPDAVFSAGVTAQNEQVLIGTHPNFSVAAVFFDQQGHLLRNEHRLASPPNASAGSDETTLLTQATWKARDDWKHEIGFSSQEIRVRRFYLVHEGIGIRELPDLMYQYLDDAPDEDDESFRPGLYEEIEQFIHDGQFVLFWCGKEFWMSRDGEVTDT